MKSITFQIDNTGKVLVFPFDHDGTSLPADQKFNCTDLYQVERCLKNVINNPEMYGITAVPFFEKQTDDLFDLSKPVSDVTPVDQQIADEITGLDFTKEKVVKHIKP